jgi:hypothetical protein
VTRRSALSETAAARSVDATQRARRALADLDRLGQPITFVGIASAAGVSRQFLYSHDELRPEIERRRQEHQLTPVAPPPHERASDESIRTRLHAALDENKRLRRDLAHLREELALAHGRARDLELANRATRPALI